MVRTSPIRPLPKILLIDDDDISREVLATMLELHGFPVQSVEDGAQALALLADSAPDSVFPDAILMDTQMPGLSGLDLVLALRESAKASGSLRGKFRIVAISGSGVSEALLQAADGFLLKPIRAEDVEALLTSAPSISETVSEAAEVSQPQTSDAIDPVVLGKLKAMMPAAAVKEIYQAVASDLEGRLAALEAAMDAGNATEVARIAHIIKGGCSMVGLSGAMEAAARLESSNLSETWAKELLQLHFAHAALRSMLGDGLP